MVKHSKSSKGNSSKKSQSRQRSSSRGSDRSRSSGRSRSNGKGRRQHSVSSSRSGSSSRQVEKPKRPLNSYNIFVREHMANRFFKKGQAMQEMKNLAAKWKTLSDDDKKKYKERADRVNAYRAAQGTK